MRKTTALAIGLTMITSAATFGQVPFSPLPDFGFGGTAYDVNASGTIVGSAVLNANFATVPVFWSSRTLVPTVLDTAGHGGFATAVSNSGVIIGNKFAPVGPDQSPVFWLNGGRRDLETLGEGGGANDVNDFNQIVGYVVQNGARRAALWQEGKLHLLPSPAIGEPGDLIHATANSINASGEIVGTVSVAFGSESLSVRWRSKEASPASLTEWIETRGIRIADSGDVLVSGYFSATTPYGAALVTATGDGRPLPPPSEGAIVWPTGLNNSGSVVGFYSDLVAGVLPLRPIAYVNNAPQTLQEPLGAQWTLPISVGEEGTVVGFWSDGISGKSHPGFWSLNTESITVPAVSGAPGENVVLYATVRKGSNAVTRRSVLFRVNGTDVATTTTNSQGRAAVMFRIPADAKPGTGEVMGSLGGGRYAKAPLTIGWIGTQLTTGDIAARPGARVNVRGTLVRKKDGLALGRQTVRFNYAGQTHSVQTNSRGEYSIPFTIPTTMRAGSRMVLTVSYPGNVNHRAATVNATIDVR